MIIWSGLGILVLVIVGGCLFAATAAVTALTSNPDYFELHGWVMGLGLLAAAAGCWFAGKALSRSGERVLLDPRTGGQVVYRRRHSLFFIPMQWWAVPLTIIGIVYCFHNPTPEELEQQRADRAARRGAAAPRPVHRPSPSPATTP